MRVHRTLDGGRGLLAYPYPYRAWLCLANDPDNTVEGDWRELHDLIWEELDLPFADALFIRSFHTGLPDQVNLADHPFIADAHPHDTIHSWGDYTFAGQKGFDRAEAASNLELLRQHDVEPRVWIDHSYFPGNLLHSDLSLGGQPHYTDLAGHRYTHPEYTLDLILEAGVRYVWDGQLTDYLGQDAPRDMAAYYRDHSSTPARAVLKTLAHRSPLQPLVNRLHPGPLSYQPGANVQYFPHTFPDGNTVYAFRRYGHWETSDIDTLHALIRPEEMDRLIRRQGTCIVYTHLGKRPAGQMDRDHHVLGPTRNALEGLKQRYDAQELMLSPVSRLLDYLVLRDHLVVRDDAALVDFRSDGIRFDRLTPADLAGFRFSFSNDGGTPDDLRVRCEGEDLSFERVRHSDDIYSIRFDGSLAATSRP